MFPIFGSNKSKLLILSWFSLIICDSYTILQNKFINASQCEVHIDKLRTFFTFLNQAILSEIRTKIIELHKNISANKDWLYHD